MSATTAMPATTTCQGSNPPNPIGTATAVEPIDKITRCPNSLHVVIADTAPRCSRQKPIAEEIASTASQPSRTAKSAASESIQFSSHQKMQTNANSGKNNRNARPGRGCESGETKLATMPDPANPTNAATATATRRKFNRSTAVNAFVETLLATSLSPSREASTPVMLRKRTRKYSSNPRTVVIRPKVA